MNNQRDISPILSLTTMRNKYSKEVDRLLKGIKRLETDPVFAAEIENCLKLVHQREWIKKMP